MAAKQRVLVSGGAGFIGSHIVDAAVDKGYEVAVLDNLSTGKRDNVRSGVELFEVDLRDRAGTDKVVSTFRPDVVSHQAAQASVAVSVADPHLDVEVNVVGSVNLLDACVRARVDHLVFASTGGALYGEVAEGTRASEDWPGAPISPYAISKLAVEQLLAVYRQHHGLASTVLRYANVYGPRQDPHGEAGVVAIFFALALAGRPLRVNGARQPGDGGCVRDYVYVSDVARANLLALEAGLGHECLNVGSGVGTTTQELATEVVRLAGRDVPLESAVPRAGDLERSVLDPSRTMEALKTLTPVREGMRETGEWYRAVGPDATPS